MNFVFPLVSLWLLGHLVSTEKLSVRIEGFFFFKENLSISLSILVDFYLQGWISKKCWWIINSIIFLVTHHLFHILCEFISVRFQSPRSIRSFLIPGFITVSFPCVNMATVWVCLQGEPQKSWNIKMWIAWCNMKDGILIFFLTPGFPSATLKNIFTSITLLYCSKQMHVFLSKPE